MATVIFIECDGCSRQRGNWKNAGGSITHCRSQLNADGWQCDHNRRKDYCPTCVAAGKAPKKRPKKPTT